MKELIINSIKYEIVKDVNDAIDKEEVEAKLTDYFYEYDYVVGDWAYSKLRLKGFYDSKNAKVSKINDIKNVDNYIKNYCAYGCKYFILKKKDWNIFSCLI